MGGLENRSKLRYFTPSEGRNLTKIPSAAGGLSGPAWRRQATRPRRLLYNLTSAADQWLRGHDVLLNIHKAGSSTSLRDPGAILLVSCYELGHQPVGLAQPLGFLKQAGYAPAS